MKFRPNGTEIIINTSDEKGYPGTWETDLKYYFPVQAVTTRSRKFKYILIQSNEREIKNCVYSSVMSM